MGIKFDINQDVLFLQGIEQGEEIGKIKAKIANVLSMTTKDLEANVIADLLTLDLKFVKKIKKQALLKDEILTALKKKNATSESVAKKLNR